ncbi:hypothetical protein [Pseudophaeobacter sp.]|uniref:hypothetical protein n=1 Tax=Pseudophaeobacter sp. TaxID=1971739 RepID=UPI004059B5E6
MNAMNPGLAIRQSFNGQRRLRGWRNTHFGGMKSVQAHPLAICRFRPDEGGTVSTALNVKLAPVSGYVRSNAYLDIVQVAVPYQAIEKLELDEQDDAGVTEMTRRRLMAKQGIGLEDEGEITKAANIHPRSVGGDKKVTKTARLAYIAAVNHMRKYAYFAATLAPKTETAILPAILTANVLERFSGVLDPEKLVDGAINLTGELPVKGIGVSDVISGADDYTIRETDEASTRTAYGWKVGDTHGANSIVIERTVVGGQGRPNIRADLDGVGELTLRDMIQSQKLDELVRHFAGMIKADPINGEAAVERALYGLSVDYDHNCQVLYRKVHSLSATHQRPLDGASINDVSAHFEYSGNFATVVPRSELGVQLVTLCMVKPIETLAKQPDPAQTEAWELVNRIHDETELDEVLLTRADLESGVDAADEDQSVFWVGHNSLKHDYGTQGPNDQQTFEVELKSSMWTYEIPTSVTPGNVNYPSEGIDMYPFYNWNGPHAEYTVSQVAAISTSMARGPNPVERIQLLADDPTLVSEDP